MGQRFGSDLKRDASQVQNTANRVSALIQASANNAASQAVMAKNNISNQIKSNVAALNPNIGMAKQQALGF
jgi:hypothetical protein